jgi:hypothetical protein
MSQTPLQAKALFESLATATGEQLQANMGSKIEALESEEEIAAAFGFELDINDPVAVELFPVRVAVGQISTILDSSLHLSAADARAHGAGARPDVVVRIETSPEAAIERYFKTIEPSLLQSVLGRPGAVESIVPEITDMTLSFFPDGSLFCAIDKTAGNNSKIFTAICEKSTSIDQLDISDDGKKIKKIQAQFATLRQSIAQTSAMSAQARAEMPAIFDRAIIDLFKALSLKGSMTIPYDSTEDFAKGVKDLHTPEGQWLPGVSVKIDGVATANIQALRQGLGIEPALTLEGAMERLRQSRPPQDEPAPAQSSAPIKKARPRG